MGMVDVVDEVRRYGQESAWCGVELKDVLEVGVCLDNTLLGVVVEHTVEGLIVG